MSDDINTKETKPKPAEFDFSAFPVDSVFHERRTGRDRRDVPPPPIAPPEEKSTSERRAKKERRKRIDPTTFEKQYTEEELEFMSAMQKFKEQSHKPFPSHGEVLKVAVSLGYRRLVIDEEFASGFTSEGEAHEPRIPSFDRETLVES